MSAEGPFTRLDQGLIEVHLNEPLALQTAVFGRCWAPSSWGDEVRISVSRGESLGQAAKRLDLPWSPQWLVEAGHTPTASTGRPLALDTTVETATEVDWEPQVRLPKLDDQVRDSEREKNPGSAAYRRRLSGEVAVAALWRSAAIRHGIGDDVRPESMDRNTRGARLKEAIRFFLERALPDDWTITTELRLEDIHGLHLRRDVGARSTDVVVIDGQPRLVAMISSKWSWRTDRGTEAAQMVPLARYRPDIPYVLVTSEFVRIRNIARESIEDRSYHLCPRWVGAWLALYRKIREGVSIRQAWPSIRDLEREGDFLAESLGLESLSDLASALGRRRMQ